MSADKRKKPLSTSAALRHPRGGSRGAGAGPERRAQGGPRRYRGFRWCVKAGVLAVSKSGAEETWPRKPAAESRRSERK